MYVHQKRKKNEKIQLECTKIRGTHLWNPNNVNQRGITDR